MNKLIISLIITLSAAYGNANQSNPQSDQQQKNLPNNFMQSLNKNVLLPVKTHPIKTFAGVVYVGLGIKALCSGLFPFLNETREKPFLYFIKWNSKYEVYDCFKDVHDYIITFTFLTTGAGIYFLYDVFTSKNVIEQNKTSSVLQGKA